MSSAEFALHVAYWQREPVGPEGQMHLWAALMAAVTNGALIRKDKQLFKGSDFWKGDQWIPPEPPKPGKRLAPDFSHLRGAKVRNRKR